MVNIVDRRIWAAIGGVAILAASALPALAAESTASVSTTVTPGVVSVSVSPTSVAYGTLPLSTSDSVRSTALSVTITATNNGTVTEDLNIKGSDSANWILSSSPADTGTVGADQFAHRFDEGSSFVDGEAAALDNTTYKTLKTGVVATSGTADFVLQMNMPTSTSFSTEQSTSVTVQAVAP